MNSNIRGRPPGHLIRRCHQIQDAFFAQETAGHDITVPQFVALLAVEKFPGIEQTALAEYIAYDNSTTGGVVDRLEAKGYVQRTVSIRDRRRKQLSLTRAGAALIKQIAPKGARVEKRLLAMLSADERRLFRGLLERIVGANEPLSRTQTHKAERFA